MRCSATVRATGLQCGKHARKGYKVCAVHGAGYSDKPGGRPITHGRYSKRRAEGIAQMEVATARAAHRRLVRRLSRVIFDRLDLVGAMLDKHMALDEKAKATKGGRLRDKREMDATEAQLRAYVELDRLAYALSREALDWLHDDPGAILHVGGDLGDYLARAWR